MATPYFTITSIAEGVAYKVKVIHGSWQDAAVNNTDYKRTLGNTLSQTMGPSYMVYKGVAKIYPSDGAGYVTLAKWREWIGIKLVTGIWVAQTDPTARQFNMVDHDGNGPIAVSLVSSIVPSYIEPTRTFQNIPFEFWQRA